MACIILIDHRPFSEILDKLDKDIHDTMLTAGTILSKFHGKDKSEYLTTLYALQKEVAYLNETCSYIVLVCLMLNVPVNNFSVMLGRSHRFLGITSTFGGKYVMLKDTTRPPEWGLNPRPLDLESEVITTRPPRPLQLHSRRS